MGRNRHLHDTLTVGVGYGLTLLAANLGGGSAFWGAGRSDPPSTEQGLLFLTLFTATHAFGASLFYALFLKGVTGFRSRLPEGVGGLPATLMGRAAGCFVYAHMAFWYGMPTAFLVGATYTPAPFLAILHVACSPPGTRLWRCIAYGSAFFSVLLLMLMTGNLRAGTPLWFVATAVAYQIALLRLQGRFVAKYFLPTP